MTKKLVKYKEAQAELDKILLNLESESVDVDEVSLKLKRAVELIRDCRQRIEQAELEVKKIVKDFENK